MASTKKDLLRMYDVYIQVLLFFESALIPHHPHLLRIGIFKQKMPFSIQNIKYL